MILSSSHHAVTVALIQGAPTTDLDLPPPIGALPLPLRHQVDLLALNPTQASPISTIQVTQGRVIESLPCSPQPICKIHLQLENLDPLIISVEFEISRGNKEEIDERSIV